MLAATRSPQVREKLDFPAITADYSDHMAVAAPLSLTAIYEPVENDWVQARVKELPGVITAAPTLEQAREMLGDAVREYLLAQLEEGDASGPLGRSEQVRVTIDL